jgi:hypothetical protein
MRLVGLSALVLVALCAAHARAADISTKKLSIKENADSAKRQFQAQSADVGVLLTGADDPGANGASVHVYSATDDMCVVLPLGTDWSTNGKVWKYKNKATKNKAQIADNKLSVKLKSGVTYTLANDAPQGAVNVLVKFGGGLATPYCMRCSGNVKDDASKFMAKACAVAACDAEPSECPPPPSPGVVLLGALPATTGRFNYNLVLGIPGSDAACNTSFPGTHTCTYAELQSAEAAGDLDGLKDTADNTVTSFWAIDSSHADTLQCHETIAWDYQTAHTGHFAEKVNLDNPSGALGTLLVGEPDNATCLGSSWVGCCQ